MQNLSQVIKKMALDAVEANKPMELVLGSIISINPIKISLSQLLIISESFILNPEGLAGQELTISLDEQTITLKNDEDELKEFTIMPQDLNIKIKSHIKKDDKVFLLRLQGGQKYFILGPLVGWRSV